MKSGFVYLQPRYNRSHREERFYYVTTDVKLGGPFEHSRLRVGIENEKFGVRIPPHFHLISKNASVCIKFCRPEYFLDGKNTDLLTDEQTQILNEILNTPYQDGETVWESLRFLWGMNNYKLCIPTVQPDYSHITIPTSLKENLR